MQRDLFWIDADTSLNEDHDSFRALGADLTFASHTGALQGIKASILKYEVLPRFCGRISLRIMTDGASPGNFTDGRFIRNGLSREHGKAQALQAVFAKNARRARTFDALRLHDFQ